MKTFPPIASTTLSKDNRDLILKDDKGTELGRVMQHRMPLVTSDLQHPIVYAIILDRVFEGR